MKGFDKKFIEELKSKNDIVDVVGKYVRLEQRGSSYWGKCPFHHEKTASFSVNSTEQFFYCFGCHKSGDVISFIMEIESLDFSDAVSFLAERAGLKLPEILIDQEKLLEEKNKRDAVYSILNDTAHFYVNNLRSEKGTKHFEYVLSRGFNEETATTFGMGASLDFDGLPKYLLSKGYKKEDVIASGAVGEKNGRLYDWLGGRLIIPHIDQFNKVIAFDGRRIDGIKEQKYINTKDTIVFSKGKTLFNINNLKKLKNESGLDSVIMVEGHLDVVSLYSKGFKNVVASMGTALTKDQARFIKRYAEKVYISYDGDSAGQKSTLRGLDILKEEGLDVKVVSLPNGLDPDDVIKKFGKEGYQKCLDEAKPLIDYKIDVLKNFFDISSIDGKRKFASSAIKVISESPSPVEQEDLLRYVSSLTKITFESLKRELNLAGKEEQKTVEVKTEIIDNLGDKETLATRFIFASVLFQKKYAEDFDIGEFTFSSPMYAYLQRYIIDSKIKGEKISFNDLYELTGEEYKDEISKIASLFIDEKQNFDKEVYFSDCVKTLRLKMINDEIEKLTTLFKEETDLDKRRELTLSISELIKKKNKLN